MTMTNTLIGLGACLVLWLFGYRREKKHVPGIVPLIPAFHIQLVALIGILVFAAHLFALLTGIEWTPPYQR